MNYKVNYGVIDPLSFFGHSQKNLAILVLQPFCHAGSTSFCLSKLWILYACFLANVRADQVIYTHFEHRFSTWYLKEQVSGLDGRGR